MNEQRPEDGVRAPGDEQTTVQRDGWEDCGHTEVGTQVHLGLSERMHEEETCGGVTQVPA